MLEPRYSCRQGFMTISAQSRFAAPYTAPTSTSYGSADTEELDCVQLLRKKKRDSDEIEDRGSLRNSKIDDRLAKMRERLEAQCKTDAIDRLDQKIQERDEREEHRLQASLDRADDRERQKIERALNKRRGKDTTDDGDDSSGSGSGGGN